MRRGMAAVALAAFATASCGQAEQPGSPPPGSVTTAPQTATKAPAGGVTVRGTVKSGVEAGCLILAADDGKQYLLLNAEPEPKPGDKVEVTGRVDRGVMTICMQGTPIQVDTVKTTS